MQHSQAIAENIRAELGRQSRSRASLARDMGVTEMWVHRRVTGETPLSVDDLAAIARVLGVQVADLMPDKAAS